MYLLLYSVDIFKTTRPLGNFAAIFLTYVASSVLHVCAHGCLLKIHKAFVCYTIYIYCHIDITEMAPKPAKADLLLDGSLQQTSGQGGGWHNMGEYSVHRFKSARFFLDFKPWKVFESGFQPGKSFVLEIAGLFKTCEFQDCFCLSSHEMTLMVS